MNDTSYQIPTILLHREVQEDEVEDKASSNELSVAEPTAAESQLEPTVNEADMSTVITPEEQFAGEPDSKEVATETQEKMERPAVQPARLTARYPAIAGIIWDTLKAQDDDTFPFKPKKSKNKKKPSRYADDDVDMVQFRAGLEEFRRELQEFRCQMRGCR